VGGNSVSMFSTLHSSVAKGLALGCKTLSNRLGDERNQPDELTISFGCDWADVCFLGFVFSF